MDPEAKKLLEDTFHLTEDNNKMLRKIRGVQKRQAFLGFVRLLLIIGIAFGAFYYLEPYLNKVMNVFTTVFGKGNTDSSSLQNLIKGVSGVPK